MEIVHNILPRLANLTFQGSNLSMFKELYKKNYMKLFRESSELQKRFIPMQWENGLEKSRFLSLLSMLNFGQTKELDTYVKQLLIVFRAGFLWLDKPHSIDVDLISSIIGFPWPWKDPKETFQESKHLDKIWQTQEKYNLASSGK